MEERIQKLEQEIQDLRILTENHRHLQYDGTKIISSGSSSSSVISGTYTPSASGYSNIDAVFPSSSHYFQIGDHVVVSGSFEADTTSTTFADFNLSLPIPSDFAAGIDGAGVFVSGTPSQSMAGMISADNTNNNMKFNFFSNNALNQGYRFIFMYKVI